ncbi:MAG TPA: hypothetical protein VMX17_08610 [Candidatus Glassbacteria bacterium]|nr:hypothetical protein [Candidatus Glassbacteria bacterium]
MKNIDKYLRVLQEQFDARIALEDVSGDFKDEWTDCYEVRCHRQFENKYEKNICKDDCRMRSAMKALSRISSAKVKCNGAPEPNRCVNTLENGILRYKKMLQRFKESQLKAQAKMREFQAKGGGT